MIYARIGKRLLDVSMAVPALIVLSPLLLLLIAIVRARLGSPALFRQPRPGLHGRIFVLWKLRTMTDEKGPDGQVLPDAARLTGLGRFLRRTSLDELPELWNVVGGDMSLVGPRPLLEEYLSRYSPAQARRHEVRPGLTGWAQVNGRNAVSWPDRFRLDVWYVDHVSLWLDLTILARTAMIVFKREGIAANAHATMPRFSGEEQ